MINSAAPEGRLLGAGQERRFITQGNRGTEVKNYGGWLRLRFCAGAAVAMLRLRLRLWAQVMYGVLVVQN